MILFSASLARPRVVRLIASAKVTRVHDARLQRVFARQGQILPKAETRFV